MKTKINKLIPVAREAITNHLVEDDKIKKEYKGYISSMGASIIQAGLLATLAFYQNDSGKKAESSKLLMVIYDILKPNHEHNDGKTLIDYIIKQSSRTNPNNQVSINDLDMEKLLKFQQDIQDILIAIKLAIRTFKMD